MSEVFVVRDKVKMANGRIGEITFVDKVAGTAQYLVIDVNTKKQVGWCTANELTYVPPTDDNNVRQVWQELKRMREDIDELQQDYKKLKASVKRRVKK